MRTATAKKAATTAPADQTVRPILTKLDAKGKPLPNDAAEWAAVNVKTGDLCFDVLVGDIGEPEKHAKAMAACAALTALGTSDWRLWTRQEAEAILDLTRFNPAVDPQFFPDIRSSWYWTASPVASYPGYAWIVHFYHGGAYLYYRGFQCRVRAVRSVARASQ
ncbi:DUF1566 domain-containing protein [Dokdonella soli]|uniref:Lcl C-terminal domain-containing protein n=1 Tax=Dokdonella soli TaxID=529810 RepID=A0ABN1IUK5_9GAMM